MIPTLSPITLTTQRAFIRRELAMTQVRWPAIVLNEHLPERLARYRLAVLAAISQTLEALCDLATIANDEDRLKLLVLLLAEDAKEKEQPC